MFFHSFPSKYQKSFCEAGKILADCKKVQVVAFFNTLYVKDKKSEPIPTSRTRERRNITTQMMRVTKKMTTRKEAATTVAAMATAASSNHSR